MHQGQRKAKSGTAGRAIAAGLVLALALPAAAQAACARAHEADALSARVLQTELMVAALSCQQQSSYNAFVIKFRDQLTANGQTLRSFFSRVHGASGTSRLNAFVTQMANEASMRSLVAGTFCQNAPAIFEQTLSADPRDFRTLLAAFPGRDAHGVPACQASARPALEETAEIH